MSGGGDDAPGFDCTSELPWIGPIGGGPDACTGGGNDDDDVEAGDAFAALVGAGEPGGGDARQGDDGAPDVPTGALDCAWTVAQRVVAIAAATRAMRDAEGTWERIG